MGGLVHRQEEHVVSWKRPGRWGMGRILEGMGQGQCHKLASG